VTTQYRQFHVEIKLCEPGILSSLNCSAILEFDPRRLRLIRGELATAITKGDASSSRELLLEISNNPFLGPLRSCSVISDIILDSFQLDYFK